MLVDVQEEVVGAPAAEGHKDIFQQNKMPLLELRDIHKTYHLGGETIRALDGVSLDIDSGEFISIIGPSGSGNPH